ncbi:hypothetical protein COE56_00895 [Bacillus anthracis]|nr:hypothetical protein COE56_00895 [Bacillus anthracis]
MPKKQTKTLSPECPVKEITMIICRKKKLLWSSKKRNFLFAKVNKISSTTLRKILLEYIHYYSCVRIQEKTPHLSSWKYRKEMVEVLKMYPVFRTHFINKYSTFWI